MAVAKRASTRTRRSEELTLKEAQALLAAHDGQGRGNLDATKLRPHFVAVRDRKNPDLIVSMVMVEEQP